MTHGTETDEVTGTDTTGHEWDGIKELNTPLPRWWLLTWYATILWAIGYWIVMPAWPYLTGYTQGVIGYSQRAVVAADIAEARAAQASYFDRIEKLSLAEIAGDAELRDFAVAGGRSAFAVNCSQCHGQGAAGSKGYPNLNDDDWIWGGTADAIHTTIRDGIRADHDDTRFSQMPAFAKDEILEKEQIDQVVEYVLAVSGQENDKVKAEAGKAVFDENCTDCHGKDAKGYREQGGPNLTDALWLFGGERAEIQQTIETSRFGVMPAWQGRLSDATLKQLAIYVHGLGGGE